MRDRIGRGARLEKHEQAATVELLELLGAAVYVLGTTRPQGARCPCCSTFVPAHPGTCQTPGIADVIAFLPGIPRPVLFIEQKTAAGRLSVPQETFRSVCTSSSAGYVTGTADAVIEWLEARGYLTRGGRLHTGTARAKWEAGE